MKVYSFYKHGIELRPLQVEVSLMKGLPQFQFMGLPDASIKESQLRIRAAIKSQGFDLPAGQQILVNLKPPDIRKSSRGLDLAVAAAFLWLTKQVPPPDPNNGIPYLYGELDLNGAVHLPDDINFLVNHDQNIPIWAGFPKNPVGYSVQAIHNLKGLSTPTFVEGEEFVYELERPQLSSLGFSKNASDLIELIAAGEHSTIMAGPAGSGKTTLAKAVYQVLQDPNPSDFLMSQRIGRLTGELQRWRPLVAPHHTTPALSMIGGGVPPFPGEITRAHGGVLILDEFLEFPAKVREALREPIENGEIVVSRRGRAQKYPAKFLLMATTNLCPCGDLVPGRNTSCRFSITRCRSYVERLSGPILDRFQILTYSHKWGGPAEKNLNDIYKKVQKAQAFRLQRGQNVVNARMSDEEVERFIDRGQLQRLLPQGGGSRRRENSIIRVARTSADLDQSEKLRPKDIQKALDYCWLPFESMKRVFS